MFKAKNKSLQFLSFKKKTAKSLLCTTFSNHFISPCCAETIQFSWHSTKNGNKGISAKLITLFVCVCLRNPIRCVWLNSCKQLQMTINVFINILNLPRLSANALLGKKSSQFKCGYKYAHHCHSYVYYFYIWYVFYINIQIKLVNNTITVSGFF